MPDPQTPTQHSLKTTTACSIRQIRFRCSHQGLFAETPVPHHG
ncbi:hypothetical protein ASZ90_011204 [hydrocarbon metagenome]|uniref:Uncharacterized protein n=1 Tax=hydrocarbon metagenome TaxID=938273 RepID=A0A0W8FDX9_9ZZZZ